MHHHQPQPNLKCSLSGSPDCDAGVHDAGGLVCAGAAGKNRLESGEDKEPRATPVASKPKVTITHPYVNGLPCNVGFPTNTPSPPGDLPSNNFSPCENHQVSEFADLPFRRHEISGTEIDDLLQILAATLPNNVLDTINLENVPWKLFTASYAGDIALDDQTGWKRTEFVVWLRDPRLVMQNQLANPVLAKEMDFSPKEVLEDGDKRVYTDFMSGQWAWRHADEIATSKKQDNHGTTLCPIILGNDESTIPFRAGQDEFYPLYISNGLIHNNARSKAIALVAILAIPHADEHEEGEEFQMFRRQLLRSSVCQLLKSVRPYMDNPEVVRYGDGYYRHTIYSLGPCIVDHPDQVLLSCIVQGWYASMGIAYTITGTRITN